MQGLKCPICDRRINLVLEVPQTHASARGAVCANEYGAHVGFIYYKFLNVKEEAQQPTTLELALN